MKKTIFTIIMLVVLILPLQALALEIGTEEGGLLKGAANEAGYDVAGTGSTTFASTLGLVVKTAMSFIGVIFLSLMVYAGYLWMTARGKEDQVEKAQSLIRSAVIGLIITIGAYSITDFVVLKILERTTGG